MTSRRGTVLAVLAVAVFTALGLRLAAHRARNNVESSGARIGTLHREMIAGSLADGQQQQPLSLRQLHDTRVALNKIAGASFREVADLLSGRSPREIAQLAQQLQDLRPGADPSISLFYRSWAQMDAKAALSSALTMRHEWAKSAALRAVVDGINPSDAEGIVTTLAQLRDSAVPVGLREQLVGKGITKWSERDPQAAAVFLDTSHPDAPSETWREVASNWAAADPRAAMEWARNQQSSEASRDALQGAISGWYQNDAVGAADYAKTHLAETGGTQMAGIVANRMALQDPTKAAGRATELSSAEARRRTEITVAFPWALSDPQAASQWAATLQPSEQAAVAGVVAGAWARTDPQNAARWIESLPPTAKDSALNSYSFALAPTDPATALGWALTVADDNVRAGTARQIASDWLLRDPAAATRWIESSPLPPESKADLLGRKPKGP